MAHAVISTLDSKKRKLYFRSGHRGTKEMDILLTRFAMQYLEALTEDQLTLYETFLEESDTDIYDWLTEKAPLPEPYRASFQFLFKDLMK